jgi:hypothetical protein
LGCTDDAQVLINVAQRAAISSRRNALMRCAEPAEIEPAITEMIRNARAMRHTNRLQETTRAGAHTPEADAEPEQTQADPTGLEAAIETIGADLQAAVANKQRPNSDTERRLRRSSAREMNAVTIRPTNERRDDTAD